MSIRFKTVQYCWWTPKSGQDPSPTQVCVDQVLPIRDWGANPSQIIAPTWTVGTTNPLPISVQIRFPELEFVYSDPNFRFKVKKTVTGVDFLNITSPKLVGDTFNQFNLTQEIVTLNFQNMENLSAGVHTINFEIEAYGVSSGGAETFRESSAIQNIIIPVSITVLSGNGFNTDKNTYQLIYNKADNSISGDTKIIVYSSEIVTFNTSDPFIKLNQIAGSSERYLNFQNNTNLQGKSVGNYSGTVTITKGTQSKTVTVNIQVINDATQFYISPSAFNLSLQKNLAESKTFTVAISNPNNLSIVVDLKPSFIETATITGNTLTVVTKNSDDLALGNYSGNIILKAGSVAKNVSVSITVLQAVINDFKGAPYYFANDENKVIVNKTNSVSSYVKMTLEMYFKGYGREFKENQEYTFPFFQGSAEIYPGKEVQDFFIKAKDIVSSLDPVYEYDLAAVNMTFQEMSSTDTVLSTFSLDNILFAPGKKPKCFPFFTDYPVRSTYSGSAIKLSVDKLSEKTDLNMLYTQYNLPKPPFDAKFEVNQFTFLRKEFNPALETKIVTNSTFQFVPLPEEEEVVHIEWENQNLVFDWFTAVAKVKKTADIENITGETNENKEEKFDSSLSKPIIVNSGWILEEEIDLITDLLMSRLCFIYIKGERFKVFPTGKKNDLADSDNNKFSMDLEFKIIIEK
ncbi:hypothetical protein [Chryseobacterium sp.]|uniref:hypothetical protein n=1 Tax=Chryseobacterium sp. TaxID=1871047 RepID=UPI0028A09AAD|nr:hypothetical protein [Chryseobacterium sp.]